MIENNKKDIALCSMMSYFFEIIFLFCEKYGSIVLNCTNHIT